MKKNSVVFLLLLFCLSCSTSPWAIQLHHELRKEITTIDGSSYHQAALVVEADEKPTRSLYIDRTRLLKKEVQLNVNLKEFVVHAFEKELTQRGFKIHDEAVKKITIRVHESWEDNRQNQTIPAIEIDVVIGKEEKILFEKSYKQDVLVEDHGFFRVKDTQNAVNQAFQLLFDEIFHEKNLISSLLE